MIKLKTFLLFFSLFYISGCANSNQKISQDSKNIESQENKSTPYHKLSFKERLEKDTQGLKSIHWDSLSAQDFKTRPTLFNKLTKDKIRYYSNKLNDVNSSYQIEQLNIHDNVAIVSSPKCRKCYLYFIQKNSIVNYYDRLDKFYPDSNKFIKYDSINNLAVYKNTDIKSENLLGLNYNQNFSKQEIISLLSNTNGINVFISEPEFHITEQLVFVYSNKAYYKRFIIGAEGVGLLYDSSTNLQCILKEEYVPFRKIKISPDRNMLLNYYYYDLGEGCPNCIPRGVSLYDINNCEILFRYNYPNKGSSSTGFLDTNSRIGFFIVIRYDDYNKNNKFKTFYKLIHRSNLNICYEIQVDSKYSKTPDFYKWVSEIMMNIDEIDDLLLYGFNKMQFKNIKNE